jgi:hypothetical protein
MSVSPSRLGVIASQSYLTCETMQQMSGGLKAGINVSEIIKLITNTKEFSGLPVRHNED